MWKDDIFNSNDISITPQSIHVVVKVKASSSSWFLSVIYTSTNGDDRKILWDQLSVISDTIYSNSNASWLLGVF